MNLQTKSEINSTANKAKSKLPQGNTNNSIFSSQPNELYRDQAPITSGAQLLPAPAARRLPPQEEEESAPEVITALHMNSMLQRPEQAPAGSSIIELKAAEVEMATSEEANNNNDNKTGVNLQVSSSNNQVAVGCNQVIISDLPANLQPATGQLSEKKTSRVLDPSGALCYHWSMVVSFAFLYNFWSLSYRFAFREIDFDTVVFWFALDYFADLIYLLDVVINFHTGYLEDGVLQRNIDKIGQHYRECTLFYLDCFCLLPLDILYLSIGFNSILRCSRLVKIYKFWSYVDRTERHTNYPNIFRTFTLVHYILVIFHWNACLFHMISKNKILDIENLYKINDDKSCEDVLCQYLHAFYWSTLALTTIGDLPRPRTKSEYFYVTVELFFGLFLFASVLGHVANIVTNVSAARKEFQAKLDAVKTFMRMRRVSDELQNKVIRWFDYLWVSQKSSDEERSVACLPDRLKAEIAIHVHLDTLKRVDIFQNTEAGFLCELVLRLKPVLFSPGDYVCRKNEVGHDMYIVSRGILEVVTEGGRQVVAKLKAGSYFGEISVLNVGLAGNKRTASVRSVGYSDLFCLNKQDLWDVLKNYPNAEARIRARAEERLSKLNVKNEGGENGNKNRKPTTSGRGNNNQPPLPPASGTRGTQQKQRGYYSRRWDQWMLPPPVINPNYHYYHHNQDYCSGMQRDLCSCVDASRLKAQSAGHNCPLLIDHQVATSAHSACFLPRSSTSAHCSGIEQVTRSRGHHRCLHCSSQLHSSRWPRNFLASGADQDNDVFDNHDEIDRYFRRPRVSPASRHQAPQSVRQRRRWQQAEAGKAGDMLLDTCSSSSSSSSSSASGRRVSDFDGRGELRARRPLGAVSDASRRHRRRSTRRRRHHQQATQSEDGATGAAKRDDLLMLVQPPEAAPFGSERNHANRQRDGHLESQCLSSDSVELTCPSCSQRRRQRNPRNADSGDDYLLQSLTNERDQRNRRPDSADPKESACQCHRKSAQNSAMPTVSHASGSQSRRPDDGSTRLQQTSIQMEEPTGSLAPVSGRHQSPEVAGKCSDGGEVDPSQQP